MNNFLCGVNGTGDFLNSTYEDVNYINDRGTYLNQFRVSGKNKTYPKIEIKKRVMSYVNEQKTSSLYIFTSVFHIFAINNIFVTCGIIRRNKENI